jgi:hypothetical protein
MELGGIVSRRRAHPLQRSQAAGHRLQAADVGYSVTRLVEQRADAKLTGLLLALYAGAGGCFSLRTADGDRPVQRAKA